MDYNYFKKNDHILQDILLMALTIYCEDQMTLGLLGVGFIYKHAFSL